MSAERSKWMRWQGRDGERALRSLRMAVEIVRLTYASYTTHNCSMRAAAIAYYILLSFFPLVVLIIVLASSFLTQEYTQEFVLAFADRYMPGTDQLVQVNIRQMLRSRGWAGALSILGLVWSGSNVFASIHQALNEIWEVEERPSIWWQRLLSIATVGAMLALFALSLVTTILGRILRSLPWYYWGMAPVSDGRLWETMASILGLLTTVIFFFTIYRLLSVSPLRWWELLPGSVIAALLWEVAKQIFATYVASFQPYNLVYGSLGRLIAFVIWSYLTGVILLLGAELTLAWRQTSHHIPER